MALVTDGTIDVELKDATSENMLKVNTDGSALVNPLPTDSDIDSINVNKMGKGGLIVAHNAITATETSSEIDCRYYNSIKIQVIITGDGTVDITLQDSPQSGGTFTDSYNENGTTQHRVNGISAVGKSFIFRGVMDYAKIVATVTGTVTVTVNIVPMNL